MDQVDVQGEIDVRPVGSTFAVARCIEGDARAEVGDDVIYIPRSLTQKNLQSWKGYRTCSSHMYLYHLAHISFPGIELINQPRRVKDEQLRIRCPSQSGRRIQLRQLIFCPCPR